MISRALPAALLDFLAAEKAEDRYASIPELLRRALQLGVIGPHQRVDRTSVWRACVRLGLPLRRVPAKQEADRRRFAYPHRMMMVLADGKHFRAGVRRRKRVALFFLDDATRFGLGVVVGTDETAELFLRGLHTILRRSGFMDVLFLDRGPGFRADDTAAACHRLDIHLVLGTAAYPEGHGKIEKFNQTAQAQVLRGLVGAADVDDDCGALEKLAKTVKASEAYQKVAKALSRGGKIANKSDAIKWIERLLHDPKSIWGKGPEEIADAFRKAGHEAIVEQSKKGSKLSKQIRIKGGDINNIQVHPGGGRHGGAYYKISSSTEGVIKVVDRATYVATSGEKAKIIFMSGPEGWLLQAAAANSAAQRAGHEIGAQIDTEDD